MRETSEEAVVEKQARVTGEVVVRKDVEQRTQTVRDNVRHTNVQVEKLSPRGNQPARPNQPASAEQNKGPSCNP
jgi:stress response protein YsnF